MKEIKGTYVDLPEFMPGMLYEPVEPSRKSSVGVVLIHSDSNYLGFVPGPELAKRGYRALAANVSDTRKTLDEKMLDVKNAVTYLKNYPGIKKVILLGHSGGATLMSAYQNVAENGVKAFQGPEKIIALDEIGSLPAADGLLLLDSNYGNGAMTLMSLDPSVTEETTGLHRDPELDLFRPQNGFDKNGCHYSEAFLRKYMDAQGKRMNRLIAYAQSRVKALETKQGSFVDDEPMVIPGANQIKPFNKLIPQDVNLFSHTQKAWPLLHKDGSVTTEVVPCLRKFFAGLDRTDSLRDCALMTTVRTFLKSNAVHTDHFYYDADGISGIEWDSSYCCTLGNIKGIHVPLLAMGMTASYEYMASEILYNNAGSEDKTLAFVEGAGHNFTPEAECEAYPGQFGDTVKVLFDFVDRWIDEKEHFAG